MTGDLLVTFNAGSSTIKIGLFETGDGKARRIARGVIDLRHEPPVFRLDEGPQRFETALSAPAEDVRGLLGETFGLVGEHVNLDRVGAAGIRVVHGGGVFTGPVLIDDEVVGKLDELTLLAPLHQPQSLRIIRGLRHLRPDLPLCASFDTAFHQSQADVVRRFALPRALHDEGIRRYGFHGLSYKFIAGELARRAPQTAAGKVVVAHLGSGASLCALESGVSRDTSMGFSTLDGIPMATRCGALDPGVLLHLMGQKGLPLGAVEDLLYHRSGLLGVSGISADSRVLLESDDERAREAIELFCFRIAGEIGRLAVTLGGIDGIVFTAGVGENQPRIRAGVCARLGWLGVALDAQANAANAPRISTGDSRVAVLVIPTDEEQVIADETLMVVTGTGGDSPS
ncbi:acetate/propionate family kinase [Chelatococcus composti]|jgi:acetate kinase|uniref:Acetate kinase n=1 Tax=Chelatococcus composti TaxID=1743235 RepID=A0A841KJE2_9HYPH|nr:acetate/propionate family kinase [Chelatococcus composti]MBB6169389.1 acetate kinase [Chelatococcus composti]MBS7736956.1 acetate/propionate family kinase [Chelatococcus composti]GGG47418.1 acetate kinase [Chelatococcus composti]